MTSSIVRSENGMYEEIFCTTDRSGPPSMSIWTPPGSETKILSPWPTSRNATVASLVSYDQDKYPVVRRARSTTLITFLLCRMVMRVSSHKEEVESEKKLVVENKSAKAEP